MHMRNGLSISRGGRGMKLSTAASNSSMTDAGMVVNALLAGDDRVWFGTGGQGGTFIYEGQSNCERDGNTPPDPACLTSWTFKRQPLPMAARSAARRHCKPKRAVWRLARR